MAAMRAGGVDPRRVVVEIPSRPRWPTPTGHRRSCPSCTLGIHAGLGRLRDRLLVACTAEHMPVDVLKIDRAFVHDVNNDMSQASMVRAMIHWRKAST
jgi:hypothetical protein